MAIIAIVGIIALPAILLLVYAFHTGDVPQAGPQPQEQIRYTQAGYKSSVTGYHQRREVQANLYQEKG